MSLSPVSSVPMVTFNGASVQLPLDLFIPPAALELWLEQFEGPLDVLLYLIKKNNADILDLPIAEITRQYTQYLNHLEAEHFELAAEYLVMAAWLAEIKSRLLLPKPVFIAEEGEIIDDPRMELVRRLQLYATYKEAALALDQLPREGRDFFALAVALPTFTPAAYLPEVNLGMLQIAMQRLMQNQSFHQQHQIVMETISVEDCMQSVLKQLSHVKQLEFEHLFAGQSSKLIVAVTFMALLELIRQQKVSCQQAEPFAPILLMLKDT